MTSLVTSKLSRYQHSSRYDNSDNRWICRLSLVSGRHSGRDATVYEMQGIVPPRVRGSGSWLREVIRSCTKCNEAAKKKNKRYTALKVQKTEAGTTSAVASLRSTKCSVVKESWPMDTLACVIKQLLIIIIMKKVSKCPVWAEPPKNKTDWETLAVKSLVSSSINIIIIMNKRIQYTTIIQCELTVFFCAQVDDHNYIKNNVHFKDTQEGVDWDGEGSRLRPFGVFFLLKRILMAREWFFFLLKIFFLVPCSLIFWENNYWTAYMSWRDIRCSKYIIPLIIIRYAVTTP